MNDEPWWSGKDSILNEKALDFIFAMWGLSKAYDRLRENDNDIHLVVECAWWIGAASEACGRRSDGGILEGFYWVRNKGFHELRIALGQIKPKEPGSPLGVGVLGVETVGGAGSPQRWLRLEGPQDGSRQRFNDHLAGRSTWETVTDAFTQLLRVADDMGKGSGLTDQPEFEPIFKHPHAQDS